MRIFERAKDPVAIVLGLFINVSNLAGYGASQIISSLDPTSPRYGVRNSAKSLILVAEVSAIILSSSNLSLPTNILSSMTKSRAYR